MKSQNEVKFDSLLLSINIKTDKKKNLLNRKGVSK